MLNKANLVVALLIGIFGAYVIQSLYYVVFSQIANIPGPWYSRFTRLRLQVAAFSGTRSQYIHDLHEKYGRIVRFAPNEVSTTDITYLNELHRVGTPYQKDVAYEYLNVAGRHVTPGVVAVRDLKEHARQRKPLARGFSQHYLRNTWEQVVREKIDMFISRIKEESAANGSADLLKWTMCFSSDVISHLAFGESFRMLETGIKAPYLVSIGRLGLKLALETELSPLYWLCMGISTIIPFGPIAGLLLSAQRVLEQGSLAVTNSKANSGSQNIFAKIIQSNEKGDPEYTDAFLRNEAGNLMIVGNLTTGNALTYLIWAILSRPSVHKAVVAELATVAAPITDTKLEALPIFSAVLDETLRLYTPSAGTMPRLVPPGGATVAGHYLPAATVIGNQAYSSHRDAEYWPDPERFDYSRWLPGENAMSEEAKASYNPFGSGRHYCIGVHLAKMELRLATACFLLECKDAKLAPETTEKSMAFKDHIVMTPRAGRCMIVV